DLALDQAGYADAGGQRVPIAQYLDRDEQRLVHGRQRAGEDREERRRLLFLAAKAGQQRLALRLAGTLVDECLALPVPFVDRPWPGEGTGHVQIVERGLAEMPLDDVEADRRLALA